MESCKGDEQYRRGKLPSRQEAHLVKKRNREQPEKFQITPTKNHQNSLQMNQFS